jgi:hypothetical protein
MSETLRTSSGARICRKCGEVLGINLGTQRRHNAEKHTTLRRGEEPEHRHTELTAGCFTCQTIATVGY